MPDRVDAKAVLALQVYEIEHMEWCCACLRWTVDGHVDTCLAGALSQTLADLEAAAWLVLNAPLDTAIVPPYTREEEDEWYKRCEAFEAAHTIIEKAGE